MRKIHGFKQIPSKRLLNAKHCTSLWSQFRGLMFSKPKTIVFHLRKPRQVCLHMCFVFFSINVFILDRTHKVIEIKRSFRPWTVWTSKKAGWFVIEAPQGSVKINIGEKIVFRETI
ncbi:MAG: DUF192 domain-containing protein [Candidatus Woesearchaeota archaeon]|nr:DUF192 domain-containing protein [Candidatus Woesearchaeota archaeon]